MAVVLPSDPQHVLHAVIELRETVELAVAEVDGSLESKGPVRKRVQGIRII